MFDNISLTFNDKYTPRGAEFVCNYSQNASNITCMMEITSLSPSADFFSLLGMEAMSLDKVIVKAYYKL